MASRRAGRSWTVAIITLIIVTLVIISTSSFKIELVKIITVLTTDYIGTLAHEIFDFIADQSQGVIVLIFIALIGEIINANYSINLDQKQFNTIKTILDDFYKETNKIPQLINDRYKSKEGLLEDLMPDVDSYLGCSLFIEIKQTGNTLQFIYEARFDVDTDDFFFAVTQDKNVFNEIVINKRIQEFLLANDQNEFNKVVEQIKDGKLIKALMSGTSDKYPLKFIDGSKKALPNDILKKSIRDNKTKILIAKFEKPLSECSTKRILTKSERCYNRNKKFVFWTVDRPVLLKEITVKLNLNKNDMTHVRMLPPLIKLDGSNESSLPHEINKWFIQGQNIMIAWDEL